MLSRQRSILDSVDQSATWPDAEAIPVAAPADAQVSAVELVNTNIHVDMLNLTLELSLRILRFFV